MKDILTMVIMLVIGGMAISVCYLSKCYFSGLLQMEKKSLHKDSGL